MGWSCRKSAGDVYALWREACVASSGSSNVWQGENGDWYFEETSRVEHDDGAITGTILKFVDGDPRGKASSRAKRVSSFRIDGDGLMRRAPKFFKDYVSRPRVHRDCGGVVRYMRGANVDGVPESYFACDRCKASTLDPIGIGSSASTLDVVHGTVAK